MSSPSANYGYPIPTPFGDNNIWGGSYLNTDLAFFDSYLLSMANNFIGTSMPPSAPFPSGNTVSQTGQFWLNSTANPYPLNIYDGTNWVTVGTLNTSTHTWTPTGISLNPANPVVITSNTSYTPSSGAIYIQVTLVAAGGGGGGCITGSGMGAAGGGGAGGASVKVFTVSGVTAPVAVTIGTGGSGGIGSSNTLATAGGNSSFGAYLTANGGSPAGNSSVSSSGLSGGGSGGGGSLGSYNYMGGSGNYGTVLSGVAVAGFGGASILGAGPNGASSGNGITATSFGAGGSGGLSSGSAVNGGAGAGGVCYIIEYFA